MNKEKIQKELQNGKSIEEVCTKYNLSFKDMMKLFFTSNVIQLPKYIYRNYSQYGIRRWQGNTYCYYGTFSTLEEAIRVKDLLIENNWELEPKTYLGARYIYRSGKWFVIKKSINNEQKTILNCKTLEEAMSVRDLLVKYNWDLDYLPLIIESLGIR